MPMVRPWCVMQTMALVLCLLGLSFAPAARAQQEYEVFTMDCAGNFHFLPSSSLKPLLAIKGLPKIVDHMVAKLKDRIKCSCTGAQTMSDDEFARKFLFAGLLNYIMGNATNALAADKRNSRETCKTAYDLLDIPLAADFGKVEVPSTCTYANYASKGCTLKITHNTGYPDLDIGLGIKQCPDSNFPFVSMVAFGSAMPDLVKPCEADSDCGGGLKCMDPTNRKPFNVALFDAKKDGSTLAPSETDDSWFKIMKSFFLYDSKDISPGCQTFSTFIKDLRGYLKTWLFKGSASTMTSTYKVCAPPQILPLASESVDIGGFATSMWGLQAISDAAGKTNYKVNKDSSWDGGMANSKTIFDASRLDGSYFLAGKVVFPPARASTGATPIMTLTCEGIMSMTIGEKVGFAMGMNLIDPLKYLGKKLYEMQQCRAAARSTTLNMPDFVKLFQIWSPALWLGMFTTPDSGAPVVDVTKFGTSTFPTPGRYVMGTSCTPSDFKLVMPKTMTFDNYMATRTCAAKFKAFSTLLVAAENVVDAIVGARDCPEDPNGFFTTEMTVNLKGTGIDALFPIRTCKAAADCNNPSLSCQDIKEIGDIPDVFNLLLAGNDERNSTCSGTSAENLFTSALLSYLTGKVESNKKTDFKICLPAFSVDASKLNNIVTTTTKDVTARRALPDGLTSLLQDRFYHTSQADCTEKDYTKMTRTYATLKGMVEYSETDIWSVTNLPPITTVSASGVVTVAAVGEVTVEPTKAFVITAAGTDCSVSFEPGALDSAVPVKVQALKSLPSSITFGTGTKQASKDILAINLGSAVVQKPIALSMTVQPSSRRQLNSVLRMHWLNKTSNAWVEVCDPHVNVTVGNQQAIKANVSAAVFNDKGFNPKSGCAVCDASGGVILVLEIPASKCASLSAASSARNDGMVMQLAFAFVTIFASSVYFELHASSSRIFYVW